MVVVRDDAGAPQGYAVYAVRVADDGIDQDGEALVREVLAATPAARVAVWEQLLGLDLVRRLRWADGPADVGVGLLLADPRAARAQFGDGLWLRLVDVDRALAARRYAAEVDLVLDVDDPGLPANAGRHRLAGGPAGAACAPTTDAPDLRLRTDTLAAAFLGGPSLRALADAGPGAGAHPRRGRRRDDRVPLAARAAGAPTCSSGLRRPRRRARPVRPRLSSARRRCPAARR